jgi:hypothetical protein
VQFNEIVSKSYGQENSAAIRLIGHLIPLIRRQIPLFASVAEFRSDAN